MKEGLIPNDIQQSSETSPTTPETPSENSNSCPTGVSTNEQQDNADLKFTIPKVEVPRSPSCQS